MLLGAAFIGGVVLASALKSKSTGRPRSASAVNPPVNGHGSAQRQALELWNNVQGALLGAATARIQDYIGELVPGFDDHYRRAEERVAAVDSSRS